jgi:hypothetical protein
MLSVVTIALLIGVVSIPALAIIAAGRSAVRRFSDRHARGWQAASWPGS